MPVALVGLLWAGYSVRDRLEARAAPTLPQRTAAEVADRAASPHPEPRSGFLELRTRAGKSKPVTADFFPAYDADGGLLVALTPR